MTYPSPRVELSRPHQQALRLVQVAHLEQRLSAQLERARGVGRQLERLAERLERVLRPIEIEPAAADADLRLGEVGLNRQGRLEMRDRLAVFALVHRTASEREVGVRQIGIDLDRVGKDLARVVTLRERRQAPGAQHKWGESDCHESGGAAHGAMRVRADERRVNDEDHPA